MYGVQRRPEWEEVILFCLLDHLLHPRFLRKYSSFETRKRLLLDQIQIEGEGEKERGREKVRLCRMRFDSIHLAIRTEDLRNEVGVGDEEMVCNNLEDVG